MDECRCNCIGGPPELIFSAVAPLPDNLEEYMFAGFRDDVDSIAKALTQDLMVPADADIVIEGYVEPGETKQEGHSEIILDSIHLLGNTLY